MKYIFALLATIVAPLAAQAVTIDLVPIGNPSNMADQHGAVLVGRVTTSYQIAKTEVTNAQYVEFLNAKAATDSLGLYNTFMGFSPDGGITRTGVSGSYVYSVRASASMAGPGGADYAYGDKPVAYVSWYDAIRFANWMNNGQGTGSTETGAYTISGNSPTPTNPDLIVRNTGAKFFLPTENEWYKAAYYNGTTGMYFDYPTGTDSPPDNHLPSADSGNSANFLTTAVTTGDPGYPMTAVGAYTTSDSPYGTFDQGGNVAEWNQTLVSTGARGRRGGAWNSDVTTLKSDDRESATATTENSSTGFRLAASAGVPGDYNDNGIVDAADYILWRANANNMSYQLKNEVTGTTPGMVTVEDYTAWRARFGNTSSSGSGSGLEVSTVPEPVSSVLAIVGFAISATSLRRKRLTKCV